MVYIPNPDVQPGKANLSNQQARENQANSSGGMRVNIGSGVRWISANSVGSEYNSSTILVGDAIGVPVGPLVLDTLGNKYVSLDQLGYGTDGYSRYGYGT